MIESKYNFKFRDNSYFNTDSIYRFQNYPYRANWNSKVRLRGKSWYSRDDFSVKCTGIKCVKIKTI